jgi:hypothetical protein
MDLAQPEERRVLWRNVLTNETQFGVVSVDPPPAATLDGRTSEWRRARRLGPSLRAMHDAAYLYLLVRGAPAEIGFDVRPGGNGGIDPEADVTLTVGPGRRATLAHAAWTDPISLLYGAARPYVPVDRAALRPGSGAWVPPRLILNRPYTVPSTGEQRPVELMDLSRLRWGSERRDVRTLAAGDGRTAELRIPWMLLGFADPSAHLVYQAHEDGTVTTRKVGPLRITLAGRSAGTYAWTGWNRVRWQERRKAGWPALRRAFRRAR